MDEIQAGAAALSQQQQQQAQFNLLARAVEALLRAMPEGGKRETRGARQAKREARERFTQLMAQQQAQLPLEAMRAELQALKDEQRDRLGERGRGQNPPKPQIG